MNVRCLFITLLSVGMFAFDAMAIEVPTQTAQLSSSHNLLSREVRVRFPDNTRTVGDALRFMAEKSGFSLAPPRDGTLQNLFAKPLPQNARQIGPTRLSKAMQGLLEDAYQPILVGNNTLTFDALGLSTSTELPNFTLAQSTDTLPVRNLTPRAVVTYDPEPEVLASAQTASTSQQLLIAAPGTKEIITAPPEARITAKGLEMTDDPNLDPKTAGPKKGTKHSAQEVVVVEEVIVELPTEAPIMVVLDPVIVNDEMVNGAFEQATLQEIVHSLAPPGWNVVIDSTRPEIKNGRWNFYTSTERQQALADLLTPMGMRYEFYFDLKDKNGQPAPLLLIADKLGAEGAYNDY